ncbi:arylsulfatase [Prosthecobacter sp.]|uniref:arylsulfatase n=1 Tax=Prosthecobacter sp. TaxID=1965333 RepID=UPI003784E3A0
MRSLLLIISLYALGHAAFAAEQRPNIIFLMCDDLGYGDVHCLNSAHGKIPTPGIDRLAAQGMTFTDAHSGSSVCTPTRYGLMTGRYSWRTKLQNGVVEGFAPSLITKDRPTVASFLRSAGYHTAIIGKWHLNFEYLEPQTGKPYSAKDFNTPPVGAKIPDGPVTRGFDYYHGFHHARDMEAVIENDTVIEHDAVVHMLPRLRRKAVEFIDSRKGKQEPFFLYLPLGSPHTPIVPSPEWQGRSGLGDYGDFVMQTDDVAVAVAEALERNGMTKNTLVIFTSDNGCSKAAGIDKLAKQGHRVSANMRGSKADIWDGGHRIPFIVRWPDQIAAGTTSSQLLCLVDFFATAAEIVGRPVPAGSCEDSVSFMPALKGRPIVSTRHGVIHHSISGHFAYRQGPWKLALAKGSGGWSSPTEKQMPAGSPKGQLYDMQNDIGETTNLFETKPEIVNQLLDLLKADIERGRSTEGPDSANDFADIVLWKNETGRKKRQK